MEEKKRRDGVIAASHLNLRSLETAAAFRSSRRFSTHVLLPVKDGASESWSSELWRRRDLDPRSERQWPHVERAMRNQGSGEARGLEEEHVAGRGRREKGDGRRGGEEESEGDGTCTSTAARRGGEADGGDVGGISGEVSPEGVVSAVGTEERPAT
jgi:hypothetical protein